MEEVGVPFTDTPLDVWGMSDGVSSLFTVTLEEVEAEGEEGLDNSVSADMVPPVLTGGRGARYLTLVVREGGGDGVFGGSVVGTGGAGDLKDLGLEGRDGLDDSTEACGLKGLEEVCGWAEGSTDRLEKDERFPGLSFWSTEVLLFSTRVIS